MLNQEQIQKYSYKNLIGLIRFGELSSEDIDQICKLLQKKPMCEKQFYDLIYKQQKIQSNHYMKSTTQLEDKMKPTNIFNLSKDQLKQNLVLFIVIASTLLIADSSFAANDAFEGILTKATGWVSGSAGKLITFISLAMAGIMGVAGFPTRYVVGSLGTGLLLSSASGLVEMIF